MMAGGVGLTLSETSPRLRRRGCQAEGRRANSGRECNCFHQLLLFTDAGVASADLTVKTGSAFAKAQIRLLVEDTFQIENSTLWIGASDGT